MIELFDELGKEHIDALLRLESGSRDNRLGDFLSRGPWSDEQPELSFMRRRITCWNSEVFGGANWCPELLPITKIYTMDMKGKVPVLLPVRDAPSHVLTLDGRAVSRLRDLGLVEVRWPHSHGNLRLSGGGFCQAKLFIVHFTERGTDLVARKTFVFLCRWLLPLRMRRRAMAIVAVCSGVQLVADLPWEWISSAIVLMTLFWHYGNAWLMWWKGDTSQCSGQDKHWQRTDTIS